jgi:hypothetical protein
MGWSPMTFCGECGEAFDEYHAPEERLCDCCSEWMKIQVLEEQGKHDERHHDHIT